MAPFNSTVFRGELQRFAIVRFGVENDGLHLGDDGDSELSTHLSGVLVGIETD